MTVTALVHVLCVCVWCVSWQAIELRVVVAQCGGPCGRSGRPSEVLHSGPSCSLTQQHRARLKLHRLFFPLCQHHNRVCLHGGWIINQAKGAAAPAPRSLKGLQTLVDLISTWQYAKAP